MCEELSQITLEKFIKYIAQHWPLKYGNNIDNMH